MRRTAGGNLRLLEKKWFNQPMFKNPPRIRLRGWYGINAGLRRKKR